MLEVFEFLLGANYLWVVILIAQRLERNESV